MNRRVVIAVVLFAGLSLAPIGTNVVADEQPLFGYSAESSRTEKIMQISVGHQGSGAYRR